MGERRWENGGRRTEEGERGKENGDRRRTETGGGEDTLSIGAELSPGGALYYNTG